MREAAAAARSRRIYYKYEDAYDAYDEEELDEIDSYDSVDEVSMSESSLSSCSRQDWLSTIAEETSFDLQTRQTLDSFSSASDFDDDEEMSDYEDYDDDREADGQEELEYLLGVEQQIEELRQRLKRFSNDDSESADDDFSIDSEGGDSDTGNEEMHRIPSLQRQRSTASNQSFEKEHLRPTSQSTGATWEIFSSSSSSGPSSSSSDSSSTDSSSFTDSSSPDGVVDPALDITGPISLASTIKDSQEQTESVAAPMLTPPNPLHDKKQRKSSTSSQQHRWIGTSIEFTSLQATNKPDQDAVSILDSSSHDDDCDLLDMAPIKVPKRRASQQLDKVSASTTSKSSEHTPSFSINDNNSDQRSAKNIDSLVVTKKAMFRFSMSSPSTKVQKLKERRSCVQAPRFVPPPFVEMTNTTKNTLHTSYQHLQSKGYLQREQKRQGVKAKLQTLQVDLSSTLQKKQQHDSCEVVRHC